MSAQLTLQRTVTRGLPVAAATIAGAVALPFAVHLLPAVNNTPMGAYLLPIFYAPLLAILLAGVGPGLLAAVIAGLVTPALNHALTGMPIAPMVTLLSLEVVVFSLTAALLHARWPRFVGLALIAFAVAKLAALVFLAVNPVIPAPPATYALNGLVNGIPGLIIMLVLTVIALRMRNRS